MWVKAGGKASKAGKDTTRLAQEFEVYSGGGTEHFKQNSEWRD